MIPKKTFHSIQCRACAAVIPVLIAEINMPNAATIAATMVHFAERCAASAATFAAVLDSAAEAIVDAANSSRATAVRFAECAFKNSVGSIISTSNQKRIVP